MTKNAKDGWLRLISWIVVIGALLVIRQVYKWVDSYASVGSMDSKGRVFHDEESSITAQDNWFLGESKSCSSAPFSAPLEGKKTGYAMSYIKCDDGPMHQINIRFWGRAEQPEYAVVNWKYTREESRFTCYELSGIKTASEESEDYIS